MYSWLWGRFSQPYDRVWTTTALELLIWFGDDVIFVPSYIFPSKEYLETLGKVSLE